LPVAPSSPGITCPPLRHLSDRHSRGAERHFRWLTTSSLAAPKHLDRAARRSLRSLTILIVSLSVVCLSDPSTAACPPGETLCWIPQHVSSTTTSNSVSRSPSVVQARRGLFPQSHDSSVACLQKQSDPWPLSGLLTRQQRIILCVLLALHHLAKASCATGSVSPTKSQLAAHSTLNRSTECGLAVDRGRSRHL
jgi:hypothetical protein